MDKITSDLARKIWLHYFNNYLRNHKIISEDAWRQMRRLIGGS